MYYVDPMRELMKTIKQENPDVELLEIEGLRELGPLESSVFSKTGSLKWRVIVTFIDNDRFETELYDGWLEVLLYVRYRLGRWMSR